MKPLDRLPKVTQTYKITFYDRVICSKDLMVWLEGLPANAKLTVTQVGASSPLETGYTVFSTEEIQHEQ